ncbi:hypothetical protein EPN52_07705 [bacterium]|nr:MAG: hypothetical protein EPN52_07705 [bacterium]
MHENAIDGESMLVPLCEARGSLGPIGRLIVLAPPHPALGIGALRVLRVDRAEAQGGPTVIVSYEGYERLP